MSFYIDVLLPFPLKNFYTYRISEEEFKFIKKGFRVLVPFGAKRVFTSIVIKKHKNIPDNYEPKEIFAFQDDLPVVDKNQIFFWKWIILDIALAFYILSSNDKNLLFWKRKHV